MSKSIQFNEVAPIDGLPQGAKINFIHEFDRDGEERGGNTIAYCVSEDGKTVYFSLSKCDTRDQYCRKTGRQLALEHARQGKIHKIEWQDCLAVICSQSPAIKDITIIRDLNFHSIARSFLNRMLIWATIRLMGKYFYNYKAYEEMVLDNLENVPSTCVICPNFEKIDEDGTEICDGCDFQDLLFEVIMNSDDDYYDEEDDWDEEEGDD